MSEFTKIETQEQLDAIISDRIKRERATITKQYEGYLSPEDAAKKYEGYLSPEAAAKKYEGYLSPEDAAKKDATIKGYETKSVKMRIAHETGIPFELAERLSGEDEAAIRKDAETISKFMSNPQNHADPLANNEPAARGKDDAAYRKMAAALTSKGE